MVWKGGEMASYGVVNKASAEGQAHSPNTGEASLCRIKADRNVLIHHRFPYLHISGGLCVTLTIQSKILVESRSLKNMLML